MNRRLMTRILPARGPILALLLAAAFGLADPALALQPFSVQDLVRLERVSDPQLSPDGRFVAYQVRETDYDANKGGQRPVVGSP